MKKHPELKTVVDVLNRADLFPHPEDPPKGGFHTCPSGWGCQLANANLFRAFEMEKKAGVWLIRVQRLALMRQSPKRRTGVKTGLVTIGRQHQLLVNTA